MTGTTKSVVAACFTVSVASVAVLAGTASPVLYGVGEATTGVTATGIISTITAILSGGGGLFALLRTPGVLDAGKRLMTDFTTGNTTALAVDDAFGTIAVAILAKKGKIDPSLLTDLGSLRQKIDVEITP